MPDLADEHANLGNTLMQQGRAAEAEAAYRAALTARPAHPGALNNLGNCLRAQGRLDEALAQYQAAVAVLPTQWGTQNNLASVLLALNRPTEAETWLRRVLTHLPDYAEAANNLGGALLAQDRLEEAAQSFEQAFRIDPRLVQARFGVAMARLGMGDFARGWPAYESRWDDPRFLDGEPPPRLPPALPRWRGEDIAGRRILLLAEQGLGDTIQFARFAPLVAARGADVVLSVEPVLVDLLRGQAPEVVGFDGSTHGADLLCPLMSLPLTLGTTIDSIPKLDLKPDPALIAQWRSRLGPRTRRRIGLVISGSLDHSDDAQRSIPAILLTPLFQAVDAEWHLLQTDIRPADEPALAGVLQHRPELTDFSQTASLASQMDLVITVDTAVAHLAAGLGLATWILLPFAADWRWLRWRADSPWYPSARLFRQQARGDWEGVAARLMWELEQKDVV